MTGIDTERGNRAEVSPLSEHEIRRYGRHLVMPEVGPEGQARLKAARVLVIGAGGLGSPVAMYLAAAGVGTLGLVDFDLVDESNLQRQILYGSGDVGRAKLEAAAERLHSVNPLIDIVQHPERFEATNAERLVAGYDLVIDGSDNFPTRYLANDACVLGGKPNVHGSVFRFEGQASVFWAEKGPCYRCLFPEPPPPGLVPSCAEGGVLGVLPGMIGSLQAIEAVKLILGVGDPLIGRLVIFDALKLDFRELRLEKRPDCPVCSENPRIRTLVEYEAACEPEDLPGPRQGVDLTVQELEQWRAQGRELVLVDVRTPMEWRVCRLEGAMLMPLQHLPGHMGELDPHSEVVVYCHHGNRSASAVGFLRRQGFDRAWNLAGGINAWSLEIDPTVPRY